MSTNHTPNYNLCQWEETDRVLRTDFNADNAKIDAALEGLSVSLDGKASAAAVDGLSAAVAGKASAAAVDSLAATVAAHTAALSGKGNCQLYAATFRGNNKYGSENPCSLTFPHKPLAVFVCNGGGYMLLFYGEGSGFAMGRSGPRDGCSVSWSGNTVSWYSSNYESQLNYGTAHVFALLQL